MLREVTASGPRRWDPLISTTEHKVTRSSNDLKQLNRRHNRTHSSSRSSSNSSSNNSNHNNMRETSLPLPSSRAGKAHLDPVVQTGRLWAHHPACMPLLGL